MLNFRRWFGGWIVGFVCWIGNAGLLGKRVPSIAENRGRREQGKGRSVVCVLVGV